MLQRVISLYPPHHCLSRLRYWIASAIYSDWICSQPAKSPIVRAILSIRTKICSIRPTSILNSFLW